MDFNDRTNVSPYPKDKKDTCDPPNIVHLLNARQLGIGRKTSRQLKQYAELKATVSELNETKCQLPPSARSTFLMSFSHDCSKVASTHGDHNIYVSDVKTGNHIQKLVGHPRTPWSIAFHPASNDILASGCLAGQVRVWDLHGGSEVWKADNDQVIASLAFHPFLQMLVIAVGNCLYFWDWDLPNPSAYCSTSSEIERIRFVKFDQYGHRLITGISNMSHPNGCMGCVRTSSKKSISRQSGSYSVGTSRGVRNVMERLRNSPNSERMFTSASHLLSESSSQPPDPFAESSSRPPDPFAESSSRPPDPFAESSSRPPDPFAESSSRPPDPFAESSSRPPDPFAESSSRPPDPFAESSSRLPDPFAESSSRPPDPFAESSSRPPDPFAESSSRPPDPFAETSCGQPDSLSESSCGLPDPLSESLSGLSDPLAESPSRPPNPFSEPSSGRSSPESAIPNDILDGVTIESFINEFNGTWPIEPSSEIYEDDSGSVEEETPATGQHNNMSVEQQESELSAAVHNNDLGSTALESSSILGLWQCHREQRTGYRVEDVVRIFFRLRSICSDLEKRLKNQARDDECHQLILRLTRHNNFQNSSDDSSSNGSSTVDPSSSRIEGITNQDVANAYAPLLSMLAHIRTKLCVCTIFAKRRLQEIRTTLNEILQKVQNWTGPEHYRGFHFAVFEDLISVLSDQVRIVQHAEENLSSEIHGAQSVLSSNEGSAPSDDVPQVTIPSVPGTSYPPENNLPSMRAASARLQEYFARRRFNPLAVARSRRNLSSQFSSINSIRQTGTPTRRFRSHPDENIPMSSVESDEETGTATGSARGYMPGISYSIRRMYNINTAIEQHNASVSANESAGIEGLLRSGLDLLYEAASEYDEIDRPISPPPLLMYSPSRSLMFRGTGMIYHDPDNDPQNHRIQSWSFSPYKLPAIYDAHANVVVRRCMIHNDASVDISQDGEKLVCLIPPDNFDPGNNLMFGVFSLRPQDMGRTLCVWGFVPNAVSVSFSPLAQYVVVGSAYSRPLFTNPEKATVAQIIKIRCKKNRYDTSYVRSFTQLVNSENRFQQVSLNCIRWLPQPGLGIVYATNRGCLSICKPSSAWIFEREDFSLNNRRNRLRFLRAIMRPN